jgi:hypothetical protein
MSLNGLWLPTCSITCPRSWLPVVEAPLCIGDRWLVEDPVPFRAERANTLHNTGKRVLGIDAAGVSFTTWLEAAWEGRQVTAWLFAVLPG